ncbi:MAG TPA: winged helix-turn-helix domain-containing protein [Desulfocapsa sulfexigens]|nr:winged helix-turn-helix domain-containing protein [Desulfocapsa sulfexigens]
MSDESKKEAMKQLRAERKSSIQKAAATVKQQKKELKLLKEHLTGDGATAPEIAEAIGINVSQVIWYLATLKQYGEVVEGTKDGCYFKYQLVETDSAEAA